MVSKSTICRQEHFRSEWFALWSERMGFSPPATQHLHRKVWEWAAVAQILWERRLLRSGKRGLGFACGTERVVSMFAALGASVEATDLYAGEAADFWKGSAEYTVSRDALFYPDLIDREEFDRRVSFYNADMNDLSQFESGAYDFVWSSCAVEHVGSYDKAMDFLRGATRLLKPGGVSVHTTEINVSDTDALFDDGGIVIFREQDFRRLDGELRRSGCCIETLDLQIGDEPFDVLFDKPPYNQGPHVKVELCDQIVTSVALVCRKY